MVHIRFHNPLPHWIEGAVRIADLRRRAAIPLIISSVLCSSGGCFDKLYPAHAPSNFRAIVGDEQLILKWDLVPGALSYNLYWSVEEGTATTGESIFDIQPGFLHEGLTNFQAYHYVISSIVSEGEGPVSEEILGVPKPVPGPPVDLAGVGGIERAFLSWAAPTTDREIAGFRIFRDASPDVSTEREHIGETSGTSSEDSGLVIGTSYFYRVVAFNEHGNGPPSNEIEVIPQIVPPTGLVATAEYQRVVLSWVQVPGATGYSIFHSQTEGSAVSGRRDTIDSGGSFVHDSLDNGEVYYYVVKSQYNGREGGPTDEVSATPHLAPPANVSAALGSGSVVLAWDTAHGADEYNIYWSTASGTGIAGSRSRGHSGSPWTHADRESNTTYYYVVTSVREARTGDTESEPSIEASVTTPVLEPPTGLVATPGVDNVTLQWDDRSEFTSYQINWSNEEGGAADGSYYGSVTDNLVIHNGLTPGVEYFYVVRSAYNNESSQASAEISATPGLLAPENLSVSLDGRSIALSWDPVEAATSYNVYWDVQPESFASGSAIRDVVQESYLHIVPPIEATYYFAVTAKIDSNDSSYESDPSSEISIDVPFFSLDAPENLTLEQAESAVAMNWERAPEGPTPEGYHIYRTLDSEPSVDSESVPLATTTHEVYRDTDVEMGRTYYYKVVPYNEWESGPESDSASILARAGDWESRSPMPSQREGLGLAAAEGYLIVAGGHNGETYYSTAEIYSIAGDSWTTGSSMAVARSHAAVAAFNGIAYVIGGTNGAELFAEISAYNIETNSWTELPPMGAARSHAAAATLDDWVYVAGGWNGLDYLDMVEAYSPESGSWEIVAPLPSRRRSLALITSRGLIYAIGGESEDGVLSNVEAYDPATDSWSEVAPLPDSRAGLAGASINGIIYVAGGRDELGPVGSVFAFDPVSEQWSEVAAMSGTRSAIGAASADGIVYVAGGAREGSGLFDVEAFDPAGNHWDAGRPTPLPEARGKAGAAVVNGRIYVVGGNNGGHLDSMLVYDPASGSWTALSSMPTRRSELSVEALGNELYAIGGNSGSYRNEVELFSPSTNQWQLVATLLTERESAASAVTGDQIYVLGGFFGGPLDSIETYSLTNDSWTQSGNLTSPRFGHSASVIDNRIYIFGGRSSNSFFDSGLGLVERHTPGTTTWAQLSSIPTPRSHLSTEVVDGVLYALGGESSSTTLATVEAYIPDTDSWEARTSMPTAREGAASAIVNNLIYLIGGIRDSSILSSVDVYDPNSDRWNRLLDIHRVDFALATIDSNIFLIGGYGESSSPLGSITRYDTANETQSAEASMPTPRNGAQAVALDGIVYVAGGMSVDGEVVDTVEAYNPDTQSWSTKQPLLQSRYRFGLATHNGLIFAIGGISPGGSRLSSVEVYDPALNSWTFRSSMPTARGELALVNCRSLLYALGGNLADSSEGAFALVEIYDPDSNIWVSGPSMPSERYRMSAIELREQIFVIGGLDISGSNLASTLMYSPDTREWSEMASLPTPRSLLGASVVDDRVFALGGENGSTLSVIEIYEP